MRRAGCARAHVALRRRSRRGPPRCSRTRPSARRPRAWWMPDVRRHGSSRAAAAGERQQGLELLRRPLALAGLLELGGDEVAELDEHLDVERGVDQPRLGQRPGRPVGGRVLLGQAAAEVVLDQRGEADARQVEQAAGELGVEQRARAQPDLGEAGEVLAWPRAGSTRRRRSRRRAARGRRTAMGSMRRGAGALAAYLDQVGALGVAVAGRALGVDGDRAGSGGDALAVRRRSARRCR